MNKEIDNWRKQIDLLDEKVLSILAKRTKIVRKIGQLKKKQNIPVVDKKRWDKLISSLLSRSDSLGLSKEFIEKLFNIIHKYSIKTQKEST